MVTRDGKTLQQYMHVVAPWMFDVQGGEAMLEAFVKDKRFGDLRINFNPSSGDTPTGWDSL